MLEKILLLLGIDTAEMDSKGKEKLEEQLSLILSLTAGRLKTLLGGTDPPESMEGIILEVAIKRYNRIGSEGITSHVVEGESMTFSEDDFAPYADEIQAFLSAQEAGTRGKLRFL